MRLVVGVQVRPGRGGAGGKFIGVTVLAVEFIVPRDLFGGGGADLAGGRGGGVVLGETGYIVCCCRFYDCMWSFRFLGMLLRIFLVFGFFFFLNFLSLWWRMVSS